MGLAAAQGLTLIHLSAQPEHFLRSFVTVISGIIPEKGLKLIRKWTSVRPRRRGKASLP